MNQAPEEYSYSFDDFPDEIKIGILKDLDFALNPGSFIALQLTSKSIAHLSKTERELHVAWFAQFSDNEANVDDYYIPGLFKNYYKLAKDTSSKGRDKLMHWLDKQYFQRMMKTLGFEDKY